MSRFFWNQNVLARNLNYGYYTDNLNHIPDQTGQPGQTPGFFLAKTDGNR